MDLPVNRFERALHEGRQQIGIWCSIPGGTAADALCLLVQVDTAEALCEIDAIAALEGVDGILTPDTAFAHRCIEAGTPFTAVGTDGGILSRGADALRAAFPGGTGSAATPGIDHPGFSNRNASCPPPCRVVAPPISGRRNGGAGHAPAPPRFRDLDRLRTKALFGREPTRLSAWRDRASAQMG